MNKNLIISYDLHQPDRDYEKLIGAIKELSSNNRWAEIQKSVWFIKSDLSPSQAVDKLKLALDGNDSLFITDGGSAAWIGLSDKVANYLKTQWIAP